MNGRFTVGLLALALIGCSSNPYACDDGVQDGVETGPDCGGATCDPCTLGLGCLVAADCASGRCEHGRCAAPGSCADGVRDGAETDVDCGGLACARCADGRLCLQGGDCRSGVCTGGTCVAAPSCSDGVKNGAETDLDCGGPTCPACEVGAACQKPGDCATALCVSGLCQALPCSNGVQDGDETDVDCGGGTCAQCGDGAMCGAPSDCLSTLCDGGVCQPLPQLCPDGYKQDQAQLCVCDLATCGSCCDVDHGNLCGMAQVANGNDCGTHGQVCFQCPVSQAQNCEHGLTDDYCATACEATACNGGCCSEKQNQNLHYCLRGDEDWACGGDGKSCQICPLGKHCVNQKCVP